MKKLLVIAAMALAAGTATAQTNEKGGHRGVDFGVNTGYSFYTKGGSGEIPVELSLGKRFNKKLLLGSNLWRRLIRTSERRRGAYSYSNRFQIAVSALIANSGHLEYRCVQDT